MKNNFIRPFLNNKYKFFLLLIFLLFVGFSFASFMSYKMAINLAKRDLTQHSLPLSSDNVYSEIQRDLLEAKLISSLMSNNTFLVDWIKDKENNIDKIKQYLKTIKTKYLTSSSFFVSSFTKNYYYEKGILKVIKEKKSEDKWFFRLKNSKNEYESNIDIDMANDYALTIFSNHKVRNSKGDFIGIAGVGIETSHVSSLLDTYKDKYNHEVYFVDENNAIIIKSKNFKKSNSLEFKKILRKQIKTFQKDKNNILQYEYLGKTYHLNIRFIEELNLFLCIEAKEDDVIKGITDNFFINIAIFVFIIILIMLSIIYYINHYQKNLEFFAKQDVLTGLSNRFSFENTLVGIFSSRKKENTDIALILLDVDNFKNINDTFGHQVGDKILVLISQVLKNSFSSNTMLARWGGEEFVVVLTNTSKKEAYALAEELRLNILENEDIYSLINKKISVSLGIALKEKDENKDELFLRVDKNLYQAKAQGKNQSVI